MTESSIRPGDLVTIDPSLDRRGLYLELRDPSNKILYAYPRIVADPDDLIVVLEVDGPDALILTTKGQKGWITTNALAMVQRRI